ncbi:MAG: hypothetical protein ACFFEF_14775 [Candidatus Thorarchaeota archaeon]
MGKKKHYIAVDSRSAMRCQWCGTTESKHWISRDEGGGIYCSTTCALAADDDNWCCIVIFPVLWIMLLASPEFTWSSVDIISIILFVVATFTLCALGPLIVSIRKELAIRKARRNTPRNSRRFDKVFKTSFLYCENCGAPLEVTNGNLQMKCLYCGFVNKVSIISE